MVERFPKLWRHCNCLCWTPSPHDTLHSDQALTSQKGGQGCVLQGSSSDEGFAAESHFLSGTSSSVCLFTHTTSLYWEPLPQEAVHWESLPLFQTKGGWVSGGRSVRGGIRALRLGAEPRGRLLSAAHLSEEEEGEEEETGGAGIGSSTVTVRVLVLLRGALLPPSLSPGLSISASLSLGLSTSFSRGLSLSLSPSFFSTGT